MTGFRITVIPLSHLRAEIVAFPFTSEAAFTGGLPDLKFESTARLWRAAERELLRASSAISFDELVAMRDDVWFSDDPDQSMPSYLRGIAQRYLDGAGRPAVPRIADGDARTGLDQTEARTDWRWLTLALPPDLLLAGLSSEGRPPAAVDTMSPILGQCLADGGFSEPHLHLNAAFDFGRLWAMCLRGLADAPCRPNLFESPGAMFDEGAELGAWAIRAAVMRYILAAFLFAARESMDFRGYLGQVCSRLSNEGATMDAFVLRRIADELGTGQLRARSADAEFRVDYAAARALYKLLIDVRLGRGPEGPDELWEWDPIHPLVGHDVPRLGTPEVQFVAEALTYIGRAEDDLAFAQLFWQVVRVRCILYRHLRAARRAQGGS